MIAQIALICVMVTIFMDAIICGWVSYMMLMYHEDLKWFAVFFAVAAIVCLILAFSIGFTTLPMAFGPQIG